jgi:co-chaperonin GroES (HSP10)
MTTVLRPCGQMILCEKLKPKQSRGGILIPETAKDTDTASTYRMRVVAIGPGAPHVEAGELRMVTPQEQAGVPFAVGDVIVCGRYNFNCDVWNPEADQTTRREFRMVRAEDVLAVEVEQ